MQPNGFKSRQLASFLSVVLLVLAPSLLRAQIAGTGNIQGTVEDSSGAVIRNASVTFTDQATLVKRATTSDASGVYVFAVSLRGTSSA